MALLMLSRTTLARRGLLPVVVVVPMQQVRFHWYQDEVRPIRDPVTGKWRYEDPHNTVQRFHAGRTSKPPREYEKPWMRRKRIADEKIYKSKKKGVDELLTYIHFVKDARKARDEEWAFGRDEKEEYKKRG